MEISNELICIMATIDMRLGPEKNKCVPLLLMPKEAKELSKFIKDLSIIEMFYGKKKDGESLDVYIQR